MSPVFWTPDAVSGDEEVTVGSGVRRLDRPSTPAAIVAPSDVTDVDMGLFEEEGEDMATTGERLQALETLGQTLLVGQVEAKGQRETQAEQIKGLVQTTGRIPIIEATQVEQGKAQAECTANTAQILAILKGAGLTADPAGAGAGAGLGGALVGGGSIAANPNVHMVGLITKILNGSGGLGAIALLIYLMWQK